MAADRTSAGVAALAARGVVSTLSWQIGRVALQFVSVIVLARLLGPRDIGLISMVVAITGIGQILRDFGLSLGAVQAETLSHAEKSNLFWINSGLGLILTLGIAALGRPIAAFYGQPELVAITQLTAVTFLLNGFATQFQAELHRRMRFGAMGFAELVSQLLGVAVAIGIAFARPSYFAIVAQQIVQAAAMALAVVLLSGWWPSLPRRDVSIRHIVRFGAGLSGTQLTAYVSKNIDNIAIGYRWGAIELGIYGRAFQLVTMPLQQMMAPISRVAVPLFSRIRHEPVRYASYMVLAQTFVVGGAAMFFGLLVGNAGLIVHFLLGARWMAAAPIIQILALGAVFKLLCQVPYWIFVSHGATGQQFKLYMVGQPVIVACILAGLPFGSIGVAWGSSVGYVLFWMLQMAWAGRVASLPIAPFLRNGLAITAVIGVPSAILPLLAARLPIHPIAGALIGSALVVSYGAALVFLLPARRRQAARLIELLRSRSHGVTS